MEILHLYYFLTLIFIISLPFLFYLKFRDWLSFGFIFPFFYIFYSFLYPINFIYSSLTERTLFYELNVYEEDIYLYIAYSYFIIFYLSWYAGFLFKFKKFKGNFLSRYHIQELNLSLYFLTLSTIFFASAYFYNIKDILSESIYSQISVYKLLASTKISSLVRACYSLWGASIVSLAINIYILIKYKSLLKYKIILYINLMAYLIIAIITGDRGQFFVVFFGSFIVYRFFVYQKRLSLRLLFILLILILILTTVRCIRGINFVYFINNPYLFLKYIHLESIINTFFFSAENIAPSISMVLIVKGHYPLLLGKSLVYLIISLLPRFLAPFRPDPSYSYLKYMEYSGLSVYNRGFCMHIATDWYFNFWIIGLIFGGFLMGYIMAIIENKFQRKTNCFYITCFVLLCGWIPQLIRSSIEGYRAFIYEYALIPFFSFIIIPKIFRTIVNTQKKYYKRIKI